MTWEWLCRVWGHKPEPAGPWRRAYSRIFAEAWKRPVRCRFCKTELPHEWTNRRPYKEIAA